MGLRDRVRQLEKVAGVGTGAPPDYSYRTLDLTSEELREFFVTDEACTVEDWVMGQPAGVVVTVADVKAALAIRFMTDAEIQDAIERAQQRAEWNRRCGAGGG